MLSQTLNSFKIRLLHLSRRQKRMILQFSDSSMILLALIASYALRFGELIIPSGLFPWLVFLAAPIIGVISLTYAGIYRRITRNVGYSGSRRTLAGISLTVLIWTLMVYLSGVELVINRGVPRLVIIAFWALSFLFVWTSREVASWYLSDAKLSSGIANDDAGEISSKRVLIWGYSETALQLIRSLRLVNNYHPVGIVDDDETLHGQKVDNIKIFPPSVLDKLIPKERVSDIFLDSTIVSREKRFEIVRQLEAFPVDFKVLPSVQDIVTGKIAIERVKNIRVEDLLGRSPVGQQQELLQSLIQDKVILVTGAGGSIGYELVRQLVRLGPKKLVLLEMSEIALYKISAELDEIAAELKEGTAGGNNPSFPEIISIIGSVCDEAIVNHLLATHKIQIIYHAAAYKHVPIVEENPVAGLENNTFGTNTLARAAVVHSVERFILISTDKAVRPTNIMGASKRLAEMVLQGLAAENTGNTVFCMVRFGNVLDSSGSVVPKFRKQLEQGGPITVTHPEVIRYFMSIKEAVGLVIQAGSMAEAGAVFVLDMGIPVKIVDLARTMIQLAGQRVRDKNNPDGDIEIEFTGLRPGEKLYEELLIGANSSPTKHPKISQLDEPFLPLDELSAKLEKLHEQMGKRDSDAIKRILSDIVEGYTSNGAG